ncbi:DUF1254 domain-containing protein [Roseomonas terrae]|jgi:hypothetical protein|uniref:DUF1254 domain-containing protein n=2 Tax=Neoroseomonas terrae TaxID=424799 RepID=A0ABS5EGP5_9PROT|nr:DUF1254 domain-containing protein [Neoroseomonas terrae]
MPIRRRSLAAASLVAGAAVPVSAGAQQAQRRASSAAAPTSATPATFAQVTKPADGVIMPEGYIRAMAQFAYAWAWPMVNQSSRRALITQAPRIGLNGGIVPVAPRGYIAMLVDYIKPEETFVTCPNQDVVYGNGYFSLDEQPVVIQVPDFADRFWVYALYDGRSDQFGQLGKPYGTRRGFYLIAGPRWQGRVPQGITGVVRSPTELANAIPRIFLNDTDEDRRAIRPVINQVMVYPLTEFTGRMKTMDYAALPSFPVPPSNGEETRWVDPERFFEQLPAILDAIAPQPGEEAIYANVRQLLNAGKADPAVARLLTESAVAAEREIVASFFQWRHNGVPAGNNWNRSKNNAQFGVDYFNRLGTAKSNMFDNRPNETQYFYTDLDGDGTQLHGAGSYAITFPAGQTPPVRGFWSMTLYNDKHLFHANPLNRFSLGTKNTNLVRNQDGSLTLYAGKDNPGQGREANWIPAPDENFSLYIRAYWGQQSVLDGTWQPPKVEKR